LYGAGLYPVKSLLTLKLQPHDRLTA
jgi:hypothetical protein